MANQKIGKARNMQETMACCVDSLMFAKAVKKPWMKPVEIHLQWRDRGVKLGVARLYISLDILTDKQITECARFRLVEGGDSSVYEDWDGPLPDEHSGGEIRKYRLLKDEGRGVDGLLSRLPVNAGQLIVPGLVLPAGTDL